MDYGYSNDYTTTSYGATGGQNGGGFMANGGSQQAAPDRAAKDMLRPLTIKQIHSAQAASADADFIVDGVPCAQVTFVAQIRNVSKQATNYTYKLDDGTGTIEAKRWIDPDEDQAMQVDGAGKTELADGVYVRVFGNLRVFNGKKHVAARPGGVRPVTDFNEVNYHMLEATAVHLYFTRGAPGGGGQPQGGDGGAGAGGGGDASVPENVSARAKRLLNALRSPETPAEGMHREDMEVKLNMKPEDVLAVVEELAAQGLIFTTVDDNTYNVMT